MAEITFYYNTNTANTWNGNPSYAVDGNENTYASTSNSLMEHDVGGHTGDNGTGYIGITKVEIRVKGKISDVEGCYYRLYPLIGGDTLGDEYDITAEMKVDPAEWCSWQDITSDSEAPGIWTWQDILDLDIRLKPTLPTGEQAISASKVELKITYTSSYFYKDLSETISLADARNIIIQRTLEETLNLAESTLKALNDILILDISVEHIALDDVLSLAKIFTRTFTETITVDDSKTHSVMIIPTAGYAVFIEDIYYERVYNVFSATYEDPNIVLTDVPTFGIETDNITGRRLNQYNIGKGCQIYRNGALVFQGEIEPRGFKKGSSGNSMMFGGPHQGYKYLQDRVCDYYRADNNSYAPVVNPWRFGRKTDATDNTLVDGLRPDEIMECLIGTKFIWQEWFDNHDFLRWTTTQAELVVYDGVLKLPKTASTADAEDSYATSGYVESIGLYNGDKHVDVMGEITTVTAKLIGTKYSTYDPVLYVCRDADEDSPTWVALTTTYDGDSIWTGTTNLAGDGASVKNQFGYYISMDGDSTSTSEIDYARFDCVTASDTGVTAGTIDPYNDPNTTDDTVAINLAGMTRLEGLEKIRQLTNTSTEHADVNWDAYIDNNLRFHFTTVRGEDVDKTFSFDNRNLALIDQKYDGKIKNALIALGQGEEPYAVTITGTDLQDTTSIAEYGKKTGYFVDKSIPDAPTLYKRAKAYLKYMKDPRETLGISICNDPAMSWDVGDRIQISDTELDISGYYRVLSRQVTKKQDADEQVKIELGTKSNTVGGLLKNISDRFNSQEVVTQGTGSPTNTLAAGLVYDTTTAAEYPFYVPKNAQRVVISVETHKFRAYSQAGTGVESTHTHSVSGQTALTDGSHQHNVTGDTSTVTSPDLDYGASDPDPSQGAVVYNNVGTGVCSEDDGGWDTSILNTGAIGVNTGAIIFGVAFRSTTADDIVDVAIRIYDGTTGYYPGTDGFRGARLATNGVCAFCIPTLLNGNGKTYYLHIKCMTNLGGAWTGVGLLQICGIARHTHGYGNYRAESHSHDVSGQTAESGGSHTHSVSTVASAAGSEHSHNISFGIYEFGYYPSKTCMKIDSLSNPIVQKFGLIGTETASAEVIDLDITDNLRDANGKIIEGAHTLYFASQTSANNADGLGIISVNHKITINTAPDVSLIPLVI